MYWYLTLGTSPAYVPSSALGMHAFTGFVLVKVYCVVTTALWSRDGSAVVSVIHPRLA